MNIIEQKNTNVNHLSKKIRNGSLFSFRAFSSAKLSVCITMRNRFKYREKGRSDYGLNERCTFPLKADLIMSLLLSSYGNWNGKAIEVTKCLHNICDEG